MPEVGEISPLRFAAVEMTVGKGVVSVIAASAIEV